MTETQRDRHNRGNRHCRETKRQKCQSERHTSLIGRHNRETKQQTGHRGQSERETWQEQRDKNRETNRETRQRNKETEVTDNGNNKEFLKGTKYEYLKTAFLRHKDLKWINSHNYTEECVKARSYNDRALRLKGNLTF